MNPKRDDVAAAQETKIEAEEAKAYPEALSGSQKRKAARVKHRVRAGQDRVASRSAFRSQWQDRYNLGTVTAMRAIHEGRAPKATEAMRRSVAKSVASIRHEDPDTAERLFGPTQGGRA